MDSIISRLQRLSTFILDLVDKLNAPECYLCGVPHSTVERICKACQDDLPRPQPGCQRCGEPWPGPGLCPACGVSPPPYHHCIAAFDYAFPVREMIHQFKYQRQEDWSRALSEAAAPVFRRHFAGQTGILVPMPIHPVRLRQRGFNQAELLARELGRYTGWPIRTDLCQRVRHTEKQSRLDARSRRANLHKAFVCKSTLPSTPVVIVDDVVTTGSTVAALSQTLIDAGIRDVSVFCLARANRRTDTHLDLSSERQLLNERIGKRERGG